MAKYISQFTGEEIDNKLANMVGASYFDSAATAIFNFSSIEDMQLYQSTKDESLILSRVPINLVSTQIKFITDNTTLYFTTEVNKAEIKTEFLTQQKRLSDSDWQDVEEDYIVGVDVDRGVTGDYQNILSNQSVLGGKEFVVDVKKYLANGENRVKITVKGTYSGIEKSLTFTVNLTSMYLSAPDFAWNKVFIEGQNYSLGGMNIGGNLSKILYIKVTGDNYEKLYTVNIGNSTYINTLYYYSGLEFPGTSGVYNVELWLDANGLESSHLNYNIIFISASEVNTVKFIALNEIAENVPNGVDSNIFGYTIYDKGLSQSSMSIQINIGSDQIINETLSNVATGVKQYYTSSLEYETEASDLTVDIIIENNITLNKPLDNSSSYPATKGASLYINEATRSNAQSNRDKFINEINGEEISAEWESIVYEGDAHIVDDEGRKCLFIPAGAKVTINTQPLARWNKSKSIEFAIKVTTASDYNENIITILSEDGRGIQIKPKNILVQSRDLQDSNKQSYNFTDEEYIHLMVTIIREYQNYGNMCKIYANGIPVTSFEFKNEDSFVVSNNLILGSNTANLYFYKFRVYEEGLEWTAVTNNVANCLNTYEDKKAYMDLVMSVLDTNYNVDYDAVYGKKNTFVVEMLNGTSFPDKLHPSTGKCNSWINIIDPIEADEDFKKLFSGEIIENQDIEGQGTTAMTYLRWNTRQKTDSKYNKRRITAKKNVASSMHSHKMGATRMYNELHNAIVGSNEANGRVAVYQYPVYGFQKFTEGGVTTYQFIGLYTIGPDKGDKITFGYDQFENSLIHLEGTDHTPMGVGYDYPWSELQYSASRESLGAVNTNGEVVAAWECGAAGSFSPDEDEASVKAMLDSEFKPAYEVAYNNSTFIKGLTLNEFNTMIVDPLTWRKKTTEDGKSYSELEFYVDGIYDLWYYNIKDSAYKTNGINLVTQTGISFTNESLEEKDEILKQWRRNNFKANMEKYWHLDDALFHDCDLILIGASDNFKKNNYPYKFKLLSDGGLWRKRQDDLDSIFDILNQGFSGKSYSVLFGDKTSSGSVFRGENSVFHTLIQECYPDEIKRMMHKIFDKMAELSPYGEGQIERLIGYIKSRFWDYAQEYFSPSAYNKDAEWTYEEAWKLYGTKYNNDVHPLQQSLGAHYEAEKDWVALRMLFMASYYNWGPFAADNGDDATEGQMTYRTASGKTFTITPAIDFNPTILVGQSDVYSAGSRIKAGEKATVIVRETGANDTHVYVQGLDWIADLGDLSDLQLTSDNTSLVLASKRLRKLKLGGESNVTTNLGSISLGDLPSLEEIDARNVTTLKGAIDLSKCPRIKTALFGNTGVTSIALANGSKITKLQTSDKMSQLILKNLPYLNEEGFEFTGGTAIEYFRIEGCPNLSGFELLKELYNLDDNKLTSIRLINFTYNGTANDVTMLVNLANNIDKNGNVKEYNGIDENGNIIPDTNSGNSIPVIEGTINVSSGLYEDDVAVIENIYGGKVAIVSTSGIYYLKFADPEVQRIVVSNWGDGTGITTEQIEAITSLNSRFNNNDIIENFDELEKFTGVTVLGAYDFESCENLKSINIKNVKKFEGVYYTDGSFASCPNLENVKGLENVEILNPSAFYNCPKLQQDIYIPKVTEMGGRVFSSSGIKSCDAPNLLEINKNESLNVFYKCSNLESVNFPNCTIIYGVVLFKDCVNLKDVCIGKIPIYGDQMFQNCSNLRDYAIDKQATSILASCFNNSHIKSIPQLANITSLGIHAFRNCIVDEDIVIDFPNLETIGRQCFDGVKNIKSIKNLGKITTLNQYIFATTDSGDFSIIDYIEYPDTLIYMGELTYYSYPSQTNPRVLDGPFIINAINPPTAIKTSFPAGHYNIYVPDQSVEAYQNATNWVTYKDRIKSMFYYLGYIDFVDPAVRDICVANFDTDGDDKVSIEEAAAVTDIGTLFKGNTEITSFNEFKYFTGVTSVGNNQGFMNTTNLQNIKLPDSLVTIGAGAFYNTKLINLSLPDSVTSIEENAFIINTLETFDTGNGVTRIAINCLPWQLKQLHFGSSVANWDSRRIVNDSGTEYINIDITVSDDNPNFISKDGILYSKGDPTELRLMLKDAQELSIPEGVTILGESSLLDCRKYERIILPEGLKVIKANAFGNTYSYNKKYINFPSTLEEFYQGVFACWNFSEFVAPYVIFKSWDTMFIRCVNLEKVDLSMAHPSSSAAIVMETFSYCAKLKEIIFHPSFNELGRQAFLNCSSLEWLDLPSTFIKFTGGNTFKGCIKLSYIIIRNESIVATLISDVGWDYAIKNNSLVIFVPDNLLTNYQNSTNWITIADHIKPISNFTDNLIVIPMPNSIINSRINNQLKSYVNFNETDCNWEVINGQATISNGVLAFTDAAKHGDVVTIKATSSVNPSLTKVQDFVFNIISFGEINSQGIQTNSSSDYYTNITYLPVESGIEVNFGGTGYLGAICEYNENFVFLRRNTTKTFTLRNDTKYIRWHFESTSLSSVYIKDNTNDSYIFVGSEYVES